ncbi:Phospholipase D precursor [Leminorella richardii]|uniref:phospholipase D n=1 Tax=Leminorella richardii TaxID=158841 RepID=A0A2X4UKN2_9GAMM|nr:phospholipase D-like domain-containing protein [Leminorella richardii]SQI39503.1 Phospholipase D precursor [Leminorella richardii]
MENNELERYLEDSLADLTLSQGERIQLRDIGQSLSAEQFGFMRNRAFDMVRSHLDSAPTDLQPVLKWLETVVKTLDATARQKRVNSTAFFSPGSACRDKIRALLSHAQQSVDICVFTIADDDITDAIMQAHKRQVNVRIITDNDKSEDHGSDIDYLIRQGVTVVMDDSPYHMHHKFAIFDGRYLLNGSFNWTRSASQHNYENVLVTDNPDLLNLYQQQFNQLWRRFD